MALLKIKGVPESVCLINFAKERIEKRQGAIYLFTGGTGEGKSYAGMRFLELWYKERFDELFPIKHICNSLEEAMLLISDFKRIGEGILIEELSVHSGVRDSLTSQNKLWNKFIDICRIKQVIIIGNTPHISFIDKHIQMMCQVWVDCERIDFKREVVIAHPLWLQTSPHKSEPYRHKFLDDEDDEIDYCYFKKPSETLSKPYDELKLKSFARISEEIMLKIHNTRMKQLKQLGQKILTPQETRAYTLYLQGYSSKEAIKELGLKNTRTFSKYIDSAKKKSLKPEYSLYMKEIGKFHPKVIENDKGGH